jgi:ribosomal protein L29
MKKRDFLKEIAAFDKAALRAKASQLGEELMRLRFKQGTNQLEKGHLLKETRRNLARVQTLLSKTA